MEHIEQWVEPYRHPAYLSGNTTMEYFEGTTIVINRIGTLRRVTLTVLEDLGFENVCECSNVYHAQEVLEGIDESLVLVLEFGISQPSRDECLFLQRLLNTTGKDIQVVVTTQKATTEFVMDMVRLGITNIIIKSYDMERFASRLKYTIQKNAKKTVPALHAVEA